MCVCVCVCVRACVRACVCVWGWWSDCNLRVLAGRGWLSNCRFKGLRDGLVIADLRVGGGFAE